MSIEIWQFPASATKADLTLLLKSLGFVAGQNLFWPGPPGTASFFWSEPRDFKSTSGVDASVFPLDTNGKEVWHTTNDWALRTRTSIWASSFDKGFQNQTVRLVRKAFGGTFHNDHYGRNRYIVVQREKSTPASRGIYAVLTRIGGELDALEAALPKETIRSLLTPRGEITEQTDKDGILRLTKQMDASRVVYNALVPFLVAAIEYFFRECFEIMLAYDSSAQLALEEQNRKLSFTEAAAILRGELALERIASGWYSFQNIDSIQKAYKDAFGIDVWRILRRRRKVREKLPVLSKALANLIGARHGVVHHFSLDRKLDREGFLDLLHLVRLLLEIVAKEGLEPKLGMRLGPG
jgi:hypothetical protein